MTHYLDWMEASYEAGQGPEVAASQYVEMEE